jgi:hypothetical protein
MSKTHNLFPFSFYYNGGFIGRVEYHLINGPTEERITNINIFNEKRSSDNKLTFYKWEHIKEFAKSLLNAAIEKCPDNEEPSYILTTDSISKSYMNRLGQEVICTQLIDILMGGKETYIYRFIYRKNGESFYVKENGRNTETPLLDIIGPYEIQNLETAKKQFVKDHIFCNESQLITALLSANKYSEPSCHFSFSNIENFLEREEPPEICSWWACSDHIAKLLAIDMGEAVLINKYGCWWGNDTTYPIDEHPIIKALFDYEKNNAG